MKTEKAIASSSNPDNGLLFVRIHEAPRQWGSFLYSNPIKALHNGHIICHKNILIQKKIFDSFRQNAKVQNMFHNLLEFS